MTSIKLFLSLFLMGTATIALGQEVPQSPNQAPSPLAAGAQPPHVKKTPEERATMRATQLQKNLLLEKDQYDKVYAIELDIIKQRETQMVKGNREANMALNQKLESDCQSRVMDVLQPAQKAKYQKMNEAEKARQQQHMQKQNGGSVPPPPPPGNPDGH